MRHMERLEKVIPIPQERECTALLGREGEVTGYINKRRKNSLGVNWVATFQESILWMAQQESMSKEQWRVFAYLIGRLDFDNFFKVPQTEIATALKMHPKAVSRAIRGLRELDIITVGPMAGHSKTYRLNPRIAHKGAKNFSKTLVEYDELTKRRKERIAKDFSSVEPAMEEKLEAQGQTKLFENDGEKGITL